MNDTTTDQTTPSASMENHAQALEAALNLQPFAETGFMATTMLVDRYLAEDPHGFGEAVNPGHALTALCFLQADAFRINGGFEWATIAQAYRHVADAFDTMAQEPAPAIH